MRKFVTCVTVTMFLSNAHWYMASFSLFSVISAGKTNLYGLSQWYDHMRIWGYADIHTIFIGIILITDDYKMI